MNDIPITFISTTFEQLSSIPITNGAIITLIDKGGLYYDTESERHKVNLLEFIPSIADRVGEPNTLYFCTGNNVIYYWADGKFHSAIGDVLTSSPKDGRQYVQKNGIWQHLEYQFECINPATDSYELMSLINLLTTYANTKLCLKIVGDGSGLTSQIFRISVPDKMELTLDFNECSIPDNVNIPEYWISNISNGKLNLNGLSLHNCLIEPNHCILSKINRITNCELSVSPSISPTAVTINKITSAQHCTFSNCNIISVLESSPNNVDFSNNNVNSTLIRLDKVSRYTDEGDPIFDYIFLNHTLNNYGSDIKLSDLSWENIRQLKNTNSLARVLSIGDSKDFTISGELWRAVIIDRKHDVDSSGNPFDFTFMCFKQSDVHTTTFSTNDERRYTRTLDVAGGLGHTLHQLIDSIDDEIFKEMIKQSVAAKVTDEWNDTHTSRELITTYDYVWPFSAIELTGKGIAEEGVRYAYFRKVRPSGFASNTTRFWTRSRYDKNFVQSDPITTVSQYYNTYDTTDPASNRGVVFGICL